MTPSRLAALALLLALTAWAPTSAATSPQGDPLQGLSDEQVETYRRGDALVREGRSTQAVPLLRDLARAHPSNAVLGLLVAAVASAGYDGDQVRALVTEADARPSDPLPSFVAGVALHYQGHTQGRTRAEKSAAYEQALRLLERARGAYADVSRLWIYLAVSYHRTDRQAQAEAAIAQAVAVAPEDDPDAFYCRAEVRHLTDLPGAIADIRAYQEQMQVHLARGAFTSATKEARVQAMLATLQVAARGEIALTGHDLFDPIEARGHGAADLLAPRPLLLLTALLVALLAGALYVRRARRGRGRPRD